MRALPTNPKGIQCSLGMIREIQQETLPETQNFLNLTALQVQFGPAYVVTHLTLRDVAGWCLVVLLLFRFYAKLHVVISQ